MTSKTSDSFFLDTLTFDQVGDLAWEIGKDSVMKWVQEFNKFSQEHAQDINKALDDFSVLYKVQKPNRKILIDIHYNPIESNMNGGPRSNFEGLENSFPIINKMGDLMYRLPQYESEDAPLILEQTIKLLHEVEHTIFQDENFNTMVKSAADIPAVAKRLGRIFSLGGVVHRKYANEPVELITTYLENIVSFNTHSENASNISPLVFRADKDLQSALIEIEFTQYKEKPNGASAKYVKAWRQLLEKHLNISDKASQEEVDIKSYATEEDTQPRYKDVYQLGRALDPSLAYEYLNSHKPIDEDFVKRLAEMAEEKVFD